MFCVCYVLIASLAGANNETTDPKQDGDKDNYPQSGVEPQQAF
jgi:hypothetical protein